MTSKRTVVACILAMAVLVVGLQPTVADGSPPFQARLVSASLKIFPDSDIGRLPEAPFRIAAVRNEYAPFQVAISASRSQTSFSVNCTRLTSGDSAIDVPANSLLLVENVLVKRPSISVVGTEKEIGNRLWPDPLPPFKNVSLKAGETRAVWVDLFVPLAAEPGLYRGSVVVSSTDYGQVELPIEIDVRPITLPVAPSVRTAFGNSALPACVEKAHHVMKGTRQYRQLLEGYYWFLVEHRLSPYHIPVDIYSDEAHRFLDDPRVTSFVVPTGWGPKEGSVIWNDGEMRRLSERLEKTGWISKGLFYVIDEPEEEAFADVAKVGKRIHSANPLFRYLMTPNSAKLLGRRDIIREANVDVWVPLITLMSKANERSVLLDEQKKGKELWWYTCIVPKWKGMNYFIDEVATAPRVHPWMNYLYGNTGILYWATDYWVQVGCDPWSATETFPAGNGDGSLLYPGRETAGPVASIRLKMLREGLEDNELLSLLGKRLKEAARLVGGSAVNYRPEDRLFEHAFALVTEEGRLRGVEGDTPYLMYVTQDYQEIEKQRNLVLDEIETALEAPLFLITASPADGAVTREDRAMIRGYAADGVRVAVNGASVTVIDRSFQVSVALVPGKNLVTVEATDRDEKAKLRRITIIRR